MSRTHSIQQHIRTGEVAAFISESIRTGQLDQLDYEQLSRKFALSQTSLKVAFRRRYRTTIHAFVMAERMNYVAGLLTSTDLPLKAIAALAGYRERSNFSRDFTRHFGTSPARWRNNQLVTANAFELIG